jgi:hypothetical protein
MRVVLKQKFLACGCFSSHILRFLQFKSRGGGKEFDGAASQAQDGFGWGISALGVAI